MIFAPTDLTDSEIALQRDVRRFLAQRLPEGSYTKGLGMVGGTDPEFSRDLGKRGWLGMALPAPYGGGRSTVERLIVVEELLAVGAPVGYHWVGDANLDPASPRTAPTRKRNSSCPGSPAGTCPLPSA
jgi:3-oxocholest-4-en-26-oyl-CoA dehydrogenase alpha subunit